MTAQIGADGLDVFRDSRPQLLAKVARVQPEPEGEWVDIEDWPTRRNRPARPGFHSTQRLWITDVAAGVAVATWPAEKASQARYLYGNGLGSALVEAAIERGWEVTPSPHIAYFNSQSSSRLYMSPPIAIAPLDYVACWEDGDALRRLRYPRAAIKPQLWRWLKQQGFADDGDDAELQRFLDEYLRLPEADMRPGLRFRRVWPFAQADELGPALADTIRSEFDALFAHAHEPTLSSVEIVGLEARKRRRR